MDQAGRRLESLTGLRWVAALAVFGFHAVAADSNDAGVLGQLFGLGYDGVSFFFVLSGFVLTWSQPPDQKKRRFWRNRFARVWPLHATVWLIVIALAISSPYVVRHRTIGSTLAGLLLVQAWVPHDTVYMAGNSPAWTLSCEACFYATFPLAVLLAGWLVRRNIWRMGLGGLVIICLYWNLDLYRLGSSDAVWGGQILPLARLPEFLIGCILASAMRDGWQPRIRTWQAVALLVATATTLGMTGMIRSDSAQIADTAILLPSVVAVIASFAAAELRGQPVLAGRTFVTLGKWSFAFYLVHGAVLTLVDGLLGHDLAAACVALVLALAVSGAAYRYWERPLELLIRNGRRPSAAPMAPVTAGEGSLRERLPAR